MSKLPRKRPSAGVIIGMLALVMAIAVPALAGSASQGKITKEKVTTIVKNLAPSLDVNSANTADSANTAKIATNIISANVNANGTMLGSIPPGATSSQPGAAGLYVVKPGRDITGCTISASLATADPNEEFSGSGPGQIVVTVLTATSLGVRTTDKGGSNSSRSFYVQMICPG